MTSERYEKAKALFAQASELEGTARDAFLRDACGEDADLLQFLYSLLEADTDAESLLQQPALDENSPFSSFLGQHLGPYRVLQVLGHGGMGAVFHAVRDDSQFRKQVAIKIIKRGMDTEEILARFRTERQILASLDHPNIARLIDGGTTDDDLPYFVMEYVEGRPIDSYCDTHRLTTVERLGLFRKVCAAVHYAHQNLVIHRDLKPGNILVTKDGEPKLLDFGIAKLLNPDVSASFAQVTRLGERMMTPDYASPEQVRGDAVTTATDVYSLGVVLYELLSGHRPYSFRTLAETELVRVICEEQPEKPSTAIERTRRLDSAEGITRQAITPEEVSRVRDGRFEVLRRRLRGDLDNIALMALRKEPRRRYASAEQLSEDIKRYLKGMPVTAVPDSIRYRARKFLRRNRRSAIAAGVVLVALIGSTVAVSIQARIAGIERERAERRFNDVRQLANTFLFEFHEAIRKLPGSVPAQELVVQTALTYLDTLSQEVAQDHSLASELAAAYRKVGYIQNNRYYAGLGQTEAAIESYRKAEAIYATLLASGHDTVRTLIGLANSKQMLGDLEIIRGNLEPGLAGYRQALPLVRRALAARPGDPDIQRFLSTIHQRLGDNLGNPGYLNAGHRDSSLAHYGVMLDIQESLAAAYPDDADQQLSLSISFEKLADMRRAMNDIEGELELNTRALELRTSLLDANPAQANVMRDVAVSHAKIGVSHARLGAPEAAMRHYRESLRLRKYLAERDPDDMRAQMDLSYSHGIIGDLHWNGGRLDSTAAEYARTITLRETVVRNSTEDQRARRQLFFVLNAASRLASQRNRPGEALRHAERSVTVAERTHADSPENRFLINDLQRACARAAELYQARGRTRLATRSMQRALELQQQLADAPNAGSSNLNEFAWTLLTCEPVALQDPALALDYAHRAVAASDSTDANIMDTLALAQFRTGALTDAIASQRLAVSLAARDSRQQEQLSATLEKYLKAARNKNR